MGSIKMPNTLLEKGQLGRENYSFYKFNPLITCRPCHRSNRLRAFNLRIQANNTFDYNAAISTRGLQLTFGGGGSRKQVLAGVDLDVPRGTFHMLLGANGCGKSTTLRVIARLLTPDSGTFSVDRPFGMVFQNPDHQVVLPTVAADVAFGLGRYNLTSQEVTAAVHHALDRVGLARYANRPTSSLSGGQKQRVAIAGALAENPRVLLLDELTTFLDARDQRNVLECVRGLVDNSNGWKERKNNTSKSSISATSSISTSSDMNSTISNSTIENSLDNPVTALWVTHRLEELEFADGVSIMDGGKVVFNGTPKEALSVMKRMGARI